MAGIRLSAGAKVTWFGALDASRDSLVVTISGSSDALPGTQTGGAKIASYAEFPPKGRATGGVRAHRFLKGEDVLLLGWAGPAPVRAASATGKPVALPTELGRRDGSGERLAAPVAAVGGPLGSVLAGSAPGGASPAASEDEPDQLTLE
jgi:DNA gyrase subunit A